MIKLLKKLLRIKEKEGFPCWVFSEETDCAKGRALLPACIFINAGKAADIRYKWKDNTDHAFVDNVDNVFFYHDGLPVFRQKVGNLFGENLDIGLGSELWYKILLTSVEAKIATAYENYQEQKTAIPWAKILLYGGIAALIIYLFKTGFIQQFLGGLINQ